MNIVTKKCTRCNKVKDSDCFYKDPRTKHGLHGRCIECEKDVLREWRQENRSKMNENRRRWLSENPEKNTVYLENRRNRIKAGEIITENEWKTVLQKYNYQCLKCGRKDVKLTLDHVVPISVGGSNTISNVQPLCLSCNSSKGTKIIDYRINYE